MDLINNLSHRLRRRLHAAATCSTAFVGCLLGTLIGVLPGIGPVATIAMLLPATYALPPVSALIMLAGIYYGAQYGGSTTAILVNLPGESSSVVTVIDGYQMARQGRAGPALAAAGLGSFFAGCVGTLILAAFAPPLTELAFKFGPAEYFSLMVLGLIGAVVLASGSLLKAIGMIVLGLLLGLVGTDVNSGVARYTLRHPRTHRRHRLRRDRDGRVRLRRDHRQPRQARRASARSSPPRCTGLCPTKEDFKRMAPAVLRGTALGSALGILPGGGALLSAFAAYTLEKKIKLQAGRSALRQGQHPRRGRPRVGQQRRRADLLHPAADAGHPAQRR